MSSPKQLYERWINELWAGRPVAGELVSDDFVGHWPDHEVHGPDELRAIIDQTHTMLTDLKFVVEVGPIVEGELLAARWIGTGAMADRAQTIHRQRHPSVRQRPIRRVLDGHLGRLTVRAGLGRRWCTRRNRASQT